MNLAWTGLGLKLAISGEFGDWAVAQPNSVGNLVPVFIYGYEAEFFFFFLNCQKGTSSHATDEKNIL